MITRREQEPIGDGGFRRENLVTRYLANRACPYHSKHIDSEVLRARIVTFPFSRYLDEHIRWVNKYGQTMDFWIVSQPILFTADPVILHEIASDLTKFRKSHFLPNR